MFKLGLIVNPVAGAGGPLGLKGSDDLRNSDGRAEARALRCLAHLAARAKGRLTVFGYSGAMSAHTSLGVHDDSDLAGLHFVSVGRPASIAETRADDTKAAAQALLAAGVDLLLFVGGDGTARDVFAAVGSNLPALGVPAGVKMHSGVYAVSPESAADIVLTLLDGGLVDIDLAEVRDIDELAFRQGQVRSKYYGELLVPRVGGFLQHVKAGGREVEELVVADIADEVIAEMDADTLYLVGPGSTTQGVMLALGLENTLLGFDLIKDQQLLAKDLNAEDIAAALSNHRGPVKVLITAIGGQGHILGRGNQQLIPELIRQIGRENFMVLATKTKISGLAGRPLLVDSNDLALDKSWEGYIRVITGYRDAIMYRVSASGE
ncbi:putative polyphosphate/ATP-dependent NAD kinase [Zhongshania antarctica]|uniref:Putative polyphosphate/ATP-dependent NAD kinase n=1 Tax=Zhongshania antarctica TaxID=641702 RepID=A0A840R775_9GAMM|nr:ATP-NAD kinase family protein [Zhongshania antarctica]MBB5188464.1 putative polyphosphate/ATP-dependent NAD kinase [Zhongshania antarctica]